MSVTGLEHSPVAASEPRFGGGASQNAAHTEPMHGSESDRASAPYPELSQIVRAWPTLSGWARWQIQELIANQGEPKASSNTKADIQSAGGAD